MKVNDPFLNKTVTVSNKLTDRLRGKYACGPHLPNGNPEFGWRQFQALPIQHEAADYIDKLEGVLLEIYYMVYEGDPIRELIDSNLLDEE